MNASTWSQTMTPTSAHDDACEAAQGARALGWASIGIGVAELASPERVEHMLGIDHQGSHAGILRVLGVRELMHGIGILTAAPDNGQLTTGIWSRVAGDALDTALLGLAATKTKRPGSFAVVAAMVTAIGVADLYYAIKASRGQGLAM
ncbi:MAG TPA: hypothetical protein VEQ85_14560 [Lacipirellulaceae bacterium]|nr:hypothetical protein [Lacipirellulaceae bacterium]